MTDGDWMTVAELANRLSVTQRTAYRWALSGRGMRILRTGPTGRGIRIHRADIERMEREALQQDSSTQVSA